MKTLPRLIAMIILGLFVLLFPLSLLMKNVGALLFDPQTTRTAIQDNFLDAEAISSAIQGSVQSLLQNDSNSPGESNPLLKKGLAALDDQDWENITSLIAPAPLVQSTTWTIVDSIVEWLDSEEELPDLSVDLQPWKRNIRQNSQLLLAVVLDALPECTAIDLATQLLNGLAGDGGIASAIPACRPPEPIYSTLLENSSSFTDAIVQSLPEEIDLGQTNFQRLDQLQRVKELLQQGKLILTWSWIALLIVGVFGVLLAARNSIEWLTWGGWPLLLAGIGTLLFSLATGFFSGDAFSSLLERALADTPALLPSLASTVLSGLGESLQRPLAVQAGILLSLGFMAIISANVMKRRANPLESEQS